MTDTRATRQQAVLDALIEYDADAVLLTRLPDIRWLTGFTGSSALLLLARDRCTLITDFRYATQAPIEVGSAADVVVDRLSVWDRLNKVLDASRVDALGIESHHLTVHDADRVRGMSSGRMLSLPAMVEPLRQIKDAAEVASIRSAAALASDALAEVLPTIRIGDRELDVAARLEGALRRRGSEWHPFEPIVASGPRAALPHASSSVRRLARGEFLLLDFGARVDGYCADITRTVALGPPDARQQSIYELVREAQTRARHAVRGGAGMTGREADALARDVIVARGFGDAFGHSLGHGLGLEVHEAPRLGQTAGDPLPVGAVVTIEPGIYLAGWGGVRIEDDVWLSPDGPVLLSDGRTDLLVLD